MNCVHNWANSDNSHYSPKQIPARSILQMAISAAFIQQTTNRTLAASFLCARRGGKCLLSVLCFATGRSLPKADTCPVTMWYPETNTVMLYVSYG